MTRDDPKPADDGPSELKVGLAILGGFAVLVMGALFLWFVFRGESFWCAQESECFSLKAECEHELRKYEALPKFVCEKRAAKEVLCFGDKPRRCFHGNSCMVSRDWAVSNGATFEECRHP